MEETDSRLARLFLEVYKVLKDACKVDYSDGLVSVSEVCDCDDFRILVSQCNEWVCVLVGELCRSWDVYDLGLRHFIIILYFQFNLAWISWTKALVKRLSCFQLDNHAGEGVVLLDLSETQLILNVPQ